MTGTANPITIQIDANKTVTAHFIVPDDEPDESFEQPEVPGPVDTSIVQDFPPLEEIVNKPVQDVPLFGLYAWVNYFGNWWGLTTHADSVGWKTIRVGGLADSGTDDYVTNMVNSGYEILAPLSAPHGNTRADFTSDDEFITAYLAYLDEIIGRYGPSGSFWQNHSDTAFHPGGDNYHPIIYWEIYNEPNEHYMFYPNSATMTEKAALYAKLLVAAHDHIRGNSDWNDINIVGFSASGVSRNDLWAPESPGYIGFVEMVHQNILDNNGYYAYTINPNTDTLEDDIINNDVPNVDTEALIIDHTGTQIDQIPLLAIEQAKDTLHIVYGHTSHGQQLIEGTRNLDAFMASRGYPAGTFAVDFEDSATSGELDFNDTPWRRLGWSEYGRDLGSKAISGGGLDDGDYTAWLYTTRKYLGWTPLPDNDGSQLDHYATGTPNYNGSANEAYTGETTYPDSANGWWPKRPLDGDRNWALDWQEGHPNQWYPCSIRYYHTQHLNHNLKAYAAWYLFARLAGWDGTP